MYSKRLIVATVATTALALTASACGADEESGPPELSDTPSPSPADASTWDAEQQSVIDGLLDYRKVTDGFARGDKLDMTALRKVAKEPFATDAAKKVDASVSAGVKLQGDGPIYHPQAVLIAGATAIVTACADARKVTYLNTSTTPPGRVEISQPLLATKEELSLVGSTWLVTSEEVTKTVCTEANLT